MTKSIVNSSNKSILELAYSRRSIQLAAIDAKKLNVLLTQEEQLQVFHQAREHGMYRVDTVMAVVRMSSGDSWRVLKISKAIEERLTATQRKTFLFTFSQLAKIADDLSAGMVIESRMGRALWFEDDACEEIDQLLGAYASQPMMASFHRWVKKPTYNSKFIKTLREVNVKYFISDDVPLEKRDEVAYLLHRAGIAGLYPIFRKKNGVQTLIGTRPL